MNISDLIKKHEGYRDKPYKCSAGRITIGYGHNLESAGLPIQISEALLEMDIKAAEDDLQSVFDIDTLYSISYSRYSVLVNMMFNLGLTRFKGFRLMIQAVKNKDFEQAALEMLDSKWAKQVGARSSELSTMMKRG